MMMDFYQKQPAANVAFSVDIVLIVENVRVVFK